MFTLENDFIRYAVIGDPVAHSVSPAMQNAGFNAVGMGDCYGKYHVTPEQLPEFVDFARKNLKGFNATVPHKAALIPLLDRIAPDALAAGSVNTVIVQDDGTLYGESTDGYGLETALKEVFDLDIKGADIVILGAGGAAQAVAFEFVRRGAAALTIVNRTRSKAEMLAEELQNGLTAVSALGNEESAAVAGALSKCSVVIQATSSGLRAGDVPPVDLELLRNAPAVFDMIYHATPVQDFARRNNIPCADGRGMLLHQGAKSFTLWTGKPAPVEVMRRALDAALNK